MGYPIKAHAIIHKAIVQAVILHGRKIWVVTDTMSTVLEGFHYRIAIHTSGMTVRKRDGGEWEWTLVVTALEILGIWLITEYVRR